MNKITTEAYRNDTNNYNRKMFLSVVIVIVSICAIVYVFSIRRLFGSKQKHVPRPPPGPLPAFLGHHGARHRLQDLPEDEEKIEQR